jgi:hypothetical protein
MARQVPIWHADSFPGGNSRQHEAVSVFNPRDSEVPLPLSNFNEVGDGSDLVSTLYSY